MFPIPHPPSLDTILHFLPSVSNSYRSRQQKAVINRCATPSPVEFGILRILRRTILMKNSLRRLMVPLFFSAHHLLKLCPGPQDSFLGLVDKLGYCLTRLFSRLSSLAIFARTSFVLKRPEISKPWLTICVEYLLKTTIASASSSSILSERDFVEIVRRRLDERYALARNELSRPG